MRVEASIKNLKWGMIYQFIFCVLNFITRKIMVDSIGVEYVGLNSLFNGVLSVLGLAEMGVGSAIIYHLYKPVAEDNKDEIIRLMNFYKTTYRFIALAITVLGVLVLPFMHYIAKGVTVDMNYVRFAYCLYLIQTVTSYFFAYKRSLLLANQKAYITTIADLVFKVITLIGSMLILYFTKSFVLYVTFGIVCGISNNLFVSLKVDKMYPYINGKLELGKEKRKSIFVNVKDIFVGQLSGRITNTTDSILISAMVGTVFNGLYGNYSMVINALFQVISQISGGISGSVGNLIATSDKKHIEEVLRRLTFIMFMIGCAISVPLMCIFNQFITLWLGEEYLLDLPTVGICVLNLFLIAVRLPLWNVLNVSGLFSKDKYISITGSAVNLVVSVIFGYKYGIIGILAGTSCTHIIQYILKVRLFYNKFLNMSDVIFYIKSLLYITMFIGECILGLCICSYINFSNIYIEFFCGIMISGVIGLVPNIVIFIKTEEFSYMLNIIKGFFSRR